MLKIPVSLGEIVDKITILKIKLKYLKGQNKANVRYEYDLLLNILRDSPILMEDNLIKELQNINQNLWEVEDKIRKKELNKNFEEEFIELARSVYRLNDERFKTKNALNQKYNSEIIEEKIYEKYN
tara:strand:+ start:519 stop:896 length:378 start_codon:yes stop_codon:yes gene_type:complete